MTEGSILKKLEPGEIQQGKVFHNAGRPSVKVLRVEETRPHSPPQRDVVFQELGNQTAKWQLPIDEFRKQFQRRKNKIK